MHGLILGTLAQQDRIVLFTRSLNERGNHSMKLTLVILVCRGLDNLNQAVETLENNLMRRRIVNLGGRGTGTLGIDEGIGLSIADRLSKRERLLKVFFSLAREANDNVGRERDIGHAVANAIDQAQIVLACITAIHLFEDPRRT